MSDATAVRVPKMCTKCGEIKPLGEFYPRGPQRPGEFRPDCKPCHLASRAVWRRANYPKLKAWYGVTVERFQRLSDAQGGVCAICELPETSVSGQNGNVIPLAVDHDHACCPGRRTCGKCVRGLLCGRCNRALGLLQDDPQLAEKAAAYLRAGVSSV